MGALTITHDGSTGELLAHVAHLAELARKHEAAVLRVARGLEFAKSQAELTKDFENGVYWQGKVDAYTAALYTLETGNDHQV